MRVAATAAWTAITGPVGLVLLAIGAVIAIGVALWRNWETITAAVGAAWDWLTGKIGQAADWIEDRIVGFATEIVERWDWIKNKAAEAVAWIQEKWERLVGFIKAIPTAIGHNLGSIFDTVVEGFKRAWNAVAGVVNRADFTLPASIPFIGGTTIGLPDLPMLAEGGSITRSGYAVVGERGPEVRWLNRGEAISPIRDGGPMGDGRPQLVVNMYAAVGSERDFADRLEALWNERNYGRGRR